MSNAHIDLLTWLNGVLDQVEATAKAAIPDGGRGEWPWDCPHEGMQHKPPSHDLCAGIDGDEIRVFDDGGHSVAQAKHIVTHDPAAVLADIAAKRAIVGLHTPERAEQLKPLDRLMERYGAEPVVETCPLCCLNPYAGYEGESDPEFEPYPCQTLRLLASAYSTWPGYQTEWAPEETP